jgi:hypothetical protein
MFVAVDQRYDHRVFDLDTGELVERFLWADEEGGCYAVVLPTYETRRGNVLVLRPGDVPPIFVKSTEV